MGTPNLFGRTVGKRAVESQHFAQSAFQHLLIRALAAAVEPGPELADTDGILGLGLLDADGQAGRPEPGLRLS